MTRILPNDEAMSSLDLEQDKCDGKMSISRRCLGAIFCLYTSSFFVGVIDVGVGVAFGVAGASAMGADSTVPLLVLFLRMGFWASVDEVAALIIVEQRGG